MRYKPKPKVDLTVWHNYFAWWPVYSEHFGVWAWLETVSRRLVRREPIMCTGWIVDTSYYEYDLILK